MMKISRNRALAIREALKRFINNPAISTRIRWNVHGAGASRMVVPNPHTELERARNRRTEIWLSRKRSELNDPGYARWVQRCLNRVLGASLAVTGTLDSPTRSAIRNLQQRQRLPGRGMITPQTVVALVRTCGFPNIRGGGVGPDSFEFYEKIPDDGQGESGGWQETKCELGEILSPRVSP
jgi:hypothetical protein